MAGGLAVNDVVPITKYISYKAPATGNITLEVNYGLNAATGAGHYYIAVLDSSNKIIALKALTTNDESSTFAAVSLGKEDANYCTFNLTGITVGDELHFSYILTNAKGGLIVGAVSFSKTASD